MKQIVRAAIILAVALAVAGAVYAWAQSGAADTLLGSQGGPPSAMLQQAGEASEGLLGAESGARGDHHEAGLAGVAQMVKPLLIMGGLLAIGAVVSTVKHKRRAKRGQPPRNPPAAAPTG